MAALRETIAELEAILGDEGRLRTVIKDEMSAVREKFADKRRSQITLDAGDMNIEDLIDDEELVVTLSHKGYIKTVAADSFRAQGRSEEHTSELPSLMRISYAVFCSKK